MRYLTIIIVAFLVASTAAQGQTVSIGPKVGLNLSNLWGSDRPPDNTNKIRAGFTGGLYFSYKTSDRWSFQAELMYGQKGWGGDILGSDYWTTIHYIEIPLSFKAYIFKEAAFNPSIHTGVTPSFMMDAFYYNEFTGNDISIRDGVRNWNLSYHVGLGLDIDMLKLTSLDFVIVPEFRYNLALLDLPANGNPGRYSSSVFQFTVTAAFRL